MRKTLYKAIFIKIAGFIIKINYIKITKAISLLNDFITSPSRNYDFVINFQNKLLSSFEMNYRNNSIILPHGLNMYVFQYFLRNILQNLLGKKKNGFFLHCSGVFLNDYAYLFLGPQGSGKSTIRKMLNHVALTLADDSGIIVKENNEYYFYQTPFIEKMRFKKSKTKFRINTIFFIEKAKCCKEIKLGRKKIRDKFFKQVWTDKKQIEIQIKILMQFNNDFNQFYQLDFPKDKEVVVNWFTKFTKLPISNYEQAHPQQNNYDNLH